MLMPQPVLLLTVLAVTATVLLILFEVSAIILTKWLTTYEVSYDCADTQGCCYIAVIPKLSCIVHDQNVSLFKHGAFVADFCVFILRNSLTKSVYI